MGFIIQTVIAIHVIAGIVALISGAFAFALRKNTPKHKPAGRIYFWSMTIIFFTGIFLSVAKGLLFFFFIAILTYYYTLVAYRSLRLKALHTNQNPLRFDWAIEIAASLTFSGLIGFAVFSFYRNGSGGAIIPALFGLIGLLATSRNILRFIKRPKNSNYWLKIHIGNMMGSYIGALTAFLVNQMDKLPLPPVLIWVGPTLIILPFIILELRKVKTEPLTVVTRTEN